MGLRKGPYVWSADAVNSFFSLKKSTPRSVAPVSSIARQMNLDQFDPVWRQEREIAAPANTDVSVNLPGPGKAGAYSLLIALGMAFARVFESFFDVFFMAFRTAIMIFGKLALLGGALFLFTLAFHLWGWL